MMPTQSTTANKEETFNETKSLKKFKEPTKKFSDEI